MVRKIQHANFRATHNYICQCMVDYYKKEQSTATFNTIIFCRKYGIPERTFYDHGTIDVQLSQIEQIVQVNIEAIIAETGESPNNHRRFFFKLLRYIQENKVYFEIYHYRKNMMLWDIVLQALHPTLKATWVSYGKDKNDMIFRIYAHEVIAILCHWIDSGVPADAIFRMSDWLDRLTTNAPRRIVETLG